MCLAGCGFKVCRDVASKVGCLRSKLSISNRAVTSSRLKATSLMLAPASAAADNSVLASAAVALGNKLARLAFWSQTKISGRLLLSSSSASVW